jgi:predicted transcriptional regulator of viral defense system
MLQKSSIPAWVDSLQARGSYTFTRQQAQDQCGRSTVAVQSALRRLRKKGRIVSPRRGFYVVVPAEYVTAGSPPASWFITDLMLHLGQAYYVGLLTAAAIHGAGHQQPMVFQVVTDRPTRPVQVGRVAIGFVKSGLIEKMPVIDMQTETGSMRVGTFETTAFDLVRYSSTAGHLSNVATVLSELSEHLDAKKLTDLASKVRMPDVQRLGYLLSSLGEPGLADPLADWLIGKKARRVPLRTEGGTKGVVDKRFHILVNEQLEIDL